MKKVFPVFILIVTLLLSSCSQSVNYTVDKEDLPKMKVIHKMVVALVESDPNAYISCFEPSYIENIKKSIDTLGTQYYGAENFADFMKSNFTNNKDHMNMNYGDDIKVDLSFEAVEEYTITDTGIFTDDYSIGYKLPMDMIKSAVSVKTKMYIRGDDASNTTIGTFVLLQFNDDSWYIHPDAFLYTI